MVVKVFRFVVRIFSHSFGCLYCRKICSFFSGVSLSSLIFEFISCRYFMLLVLVFLLGFVFINFHRFFWIFWFYLFYYHNLVCFVYYVIQYSYIVFVGNFLLCYLAQLSIFCIIFLLFFYYAKHEFIIGCYLVF